MLGLKQSFDDKKMREENSQLTDEEIAKQVQKGDIEPFGILVRRYEDKIIRYARKFLVNQEDIKDIVQEVFIRAFKNIQSFDVKRSFSTWLYRIAHNQFVNALKKEKRKRLFSFNTDVFLPHWMPKEDIETDFQKQEAFQMLDECLDKLEPKYREPLILYYFEDLGYKEIADILQLPVSTAGIRLQRAKKKLKSIYEQQ